MSLSSAHIAYCVSVQVTRRSGSLADRDPHHTRTLSRRVPRTYGYIWSAGLLQALSRLQFLSSHTAPCRSRAPSQLAGSGRAMTSPTAAACLGGATPLRDRPCATRYRPPSSSFTPQTCSPTTPPTSPGLRAATLPTPSPMKTRTPRLLSRRRRPAQTLRLASGPRPRSPTT